MKKILALMLVILLFLTSCDLALDNILGGGQTTTPDIVIDTTKDDESNNDQTNDDPNNDQTNDDPNNDQTGDTPGTDTPGTDTPGTDNPGTDTPGTDNPGTDTPGTDNPGTDNPGTDTPGTEQPVHDYKATVTAPTCDAQGYTTYICIICNDSYIADYTNALGHAWKDATTEAPKTCTTCGKTEGDKLPSIDTLYVHYIDVGQGDSIFIRVGDCDILIDAGTASYGTTVSNYLKKQGVDDVELMINTHADADHCGGLTQVLNDHVVEEVWISKDTNKNTAAYRNFTSAITREGLTAKKPEAGTVYTYEYLTITVLYNAVGSNTNNSSIVVMLEYGSFRFLFTGDIGEDVEKKLVNEKADLECDVLKVGHHGSKTSSTAAFLSAVSAEYGVICVGTGNSYGHPTSAALNRLNSAGVSVYRTDLDGDVVFSTNGTTLYLPNGSTDNTGSVKN